MVLEHPGPVKVLGPGRCKRFSAYIDDGKVRERDFRSTFQYSADRCVGNSDLAEPCESSYFLRDCAQIELFNLSYSEEDPAGADKPENSCVEKMMSQLDEIL